MNRVPPEQRDAFAERGGRLTNDAVSAVLDVAVAAKEESTGTPSSGIGTWSAMSRLVGFLGSVFIDTANSSVGDRSGQLIMTGPGWSTCEVPNNR